MRIRRPKSNYSILGRYKHFLISKPVHFNTSIHQRNPKVDKSVHGIALGFEGVRLDMELS